MPREDDEDSVSDRTFQDLQKQLEYEREVARLLALRQTDEQRARDAVQDAAVVDLKDRLQKSEGTRALLRKELDAALADVDRLKVFCYGDPNEEGDVGLKRVKKWGNWAIMTAGLAAALGLSGVGAVVYFVQQALAAAKASGG